MPGHNSISREAEVVSYLGAAVASRIEIAQAKYEGQRQKLDGLDRDFFEAKAQGILATPMGEAIVTERGACFMQVSQASKQIRDLEALRGTNLSMGGLMKEGAIRAGHFTRGVMLALTWTCCAATVAPLAKKFFNGSFVHGRLHAFIHSTCEEGAHADFGRAFETLSEGHFSQRLWGSSQRTNKIKTEVMFPVPRPRNLTTLFRAPAAPHDEESGLLLQDMEHSDEEEPALTSESGALVPWNSRE